MKIFLPFQKEINPYIDEIIEESEHLWFYGNFRAYNSSYDAVNIHWPEAIFDWKEPATDELEELEKHLLIWKKNSSLIYTKHDFQRNKGATVNFIKLFNLIERHSDIFIHLGKYSHNLYKEKYPLAHHTIIPHPLYEKSFHQHNIEHARETLGISQDAYVVIVPGTIRTYAERDLILNSFASIRVKNKVLICTNMHAELRYDFPGRIMLKKMVDVKKRLVSRFKQKYQPPHFYFTYGIQPKEDIEIKMSSADLVFIPRYEILNSGILFLGLTYNKIVVGPSTGNITEHLEEFGLPVFNPDRKKSILGALTKGYEKVKGHKNYPEAILKKYKPVSVAVEIDDLINDLK